MKNPLTQNADSLISSIRIAHSPEPSLARQHLEYILMIERNRAALTQHMMDNTSILMEVATQIMIDNPATAGALKEIMEAYLDASSDSIKRYGNSMINTKGRYKK